VKKLENRSIFDEVIRRTKSVPVFWATLYTIRKKSSLHSGYANDWSILLCCAAPGGLSLPEAVYIMQQIGKTGLTLLMLV